MALLTTEQRLLAPVLGGRQTVWTGRPLRGFRLRKGDAGQLAPLLVALPFLAFWEVMVTRTAGAAEVAGIAFPVFGIIISVLIVAQTCGPVLWNFYARTHTYYALTADGNAILHTDLLGGSTKIIYLPSIATIDLDMKPDGSGSISFGEVQTPPWWMSNRTWFVPRAPSFDCIANVSDVYDLCTKLQQGKST